MQAERVHKVALVGIEAGSDKDESLRWDCISWNSLSEQVNLHDYDTWVFYMPGFPEVVEKTQYSRC